MANFSSSGLTFFVFVIIFTVVCGIFLLLRLWAATVSRRSLYLDDAFILFAYVSLSQSMHPAYTKCTVGSQTNCIALGGVGLWAAVNGLGKSGAELSPEELAANAKVRADTAPGSVMLTSAALVRHNISCVLANRERLR
ncbi:hypothetical protein F5B20DRAFT_537833 [Whalleya microplaca]|nr:hypothetical protein F5B20DRAFT_537833 [Whalleya microplaca]